MSSLLANRLSSSLIRLTVRAALQPRNVNLVRNMATNAKKPTSTFKMALVGKLNQFNSVLWQIIDA